VGLDEPAAIIQVTAAAGSIYADQAITGRELLPMRLRNIDLPFATPGGLIETKVYYRGRGTLRLGPISVQPIAVPKASVHFRDWPLVFCWVGGTFLVGWLFVQVMTLSRKRGTVREDNSDRAAGP
jgi:hypothetical protein